MFIDDMNSIFHEIDKEVNKQISRLEELLLENVKNLSSELKNQKTAAIEQIIDDLKRINEDTRQRIINEKTNEINQNIGFIHEVSFKKDDNTSVIEGVKILISNAIEYSIESK